KQGDEFISSKNVEPAVRDAALITSAQKVEHYEIALYGLARSHARMLGYLKIAELLGDTLKEEEETHLQLSRLAERRVNPDAVKAPFAHARTAPRAGDEVGGWGFAGLLAGVFIGAAVALLYAPKPGSKIRRELRDTADEWRNTAEDLIERGKQTISDQRD